MVNWSLATRPRKLGGLGIRDIKIANQALLIKWMWQWRQSDDRQAWWKAPTSMAHTSDRPWDDPNASPFWKSISHLQPQFDCSVSSRIGNGDNTKFWHDSWIGTKLKWSFPNLYHHSTNKQAAVSQCTVRNEWCLHLPNLTAVAENEKLMLHAYLQQVRLPLTQLHDEIIWNRDSAAFSVGSAYRFISHTPSPTSHIQHMWQIRAPNRVMVFAWLLLNNRLTTVDNLARRGWLLPNMCTMCKTAAETVPHLFSQCSVAVQVRTYILSALPHATLLPNKFATFSSTEMLTDSGENANARKWEITTCYILWRERCRRIFANKNQSHLALVREIKSEISNWFGI